MSSTSGAYASARAAVSRAWRTLLPLEGRRPGEAAAYREHLLASAWGGIGNGVVFLTDVILAKTLHAPGWQITLLATLAPAANLCSFHFAGLVRGRSKGRFFLLAGLLGRLPLVLVLLRPTAFWVIALYLLVNVSNALIITASNAVYQARYSDATRTQRFGLATSVAGITSMAVTYGAGLLLQADDSRFPLLYLLAAVAGVLQTWHLYRMATPASDLPRAAGWVMERLGGWRLLREWPEPWSPRVTGARMNAAQREFRATLRSTLHLLRDHPEFVRFERNYMIYGFAFMFLVPVLPLYVVHDLGMDYHQLSLTKGLWGQVGIVLLSPFLGLAMERLNPLRFTGKVFFALSLFPLCLLASTFGGFWSPVTWVYAALLFFSLAMAGVNISWSLGSMYFAGDEDASAFQGLHVAMTGVRGLIAPTIGYVLYELTGPRLVFLAAAVLLWVGSFLMLRQGSRMPPPARATVLK